MGQMNDDVFYVDTNGQCAGAKILAIPNPSEPDRANLIVFLDAASPATSYEVGVYKQGDPSAPSIYPCWSETMPSGRMSAMKTAPKKR